MVLLTMGVAETVRPRRVLSSSKRRRWLSNLGVAFLSSIITRLLIPIIPTTVALYCQTNGYGVFNQIDVSPLIAIIANVLLLDMVIYWQHVAFHKFTILWRIHRMHHADTDIDASTGIRFHPIEIACSMLIKLAVVFLLGPPVISVIIFEILLNGCALFNHANCRLPLRLDALLRLFVVTPDMHRVHHSTNMREANMNYGFNFPWWDRLFGTYKPQPDLGHTDMNIGLNIFRDPKYLSLSQILMIPFR